MKVVKVQIVLGVGFESWTQYFSDYPTLNLIRTLLAKSRCCGHRNLSNFAEAIPPDPWQIDNVTGDMSQMIFTYGVPVGTITMSQKNVYTCNDECIYKEE